MKTITKEFIVYEYQELSEEAKKFAFEKWQEMNSHEFFWHNESIDCLENFLGFFGLKIKNFSLGLYNDNFIEWGKNQVEQNILELSGNRLLKYINNNVKQKGKYLKSFDKDFSKYFKFNREVKFYKGSNETVTYFYSKIEKEYSGTGYCFDYIFIEEIKKIEKYIREKKGVMFQTFINFCTQAFIAEYQSDYKNQISKDMFIEKTTDNKTQFLESGEVYEIC